MFRPERRIALENLLSRGPVSKAVEDHRYGNAGTRDAEFSAADVRVTGNVPLPGDHEFIIAPGAGEADFQRDARSRRIVVDSGSPAIGTGRNRGTSAGFSPSAMRSAITSIASRSASPIRFIAILPVAHYAGKFHHFGDTAAVVLATEIDRQVHESMIAGSAVDIALPQTDVALTVACPYWATACFLAAGLFTGARSFLPSSITHAPSELRL